LKAQNIFSYNKDVENQLKEIRKTIRLSMNGVASDAMRHLEYKQNYGVALPRIKEIACKYEKNSFLATRLWSTGIREMMILATLLQPADDIPQEKAYGWIKDCHNLELVEQCCRNIWVNVPYANKLAAEMVIEEDIYRKATGYITYSLLLAKETAEENIMDLFLRSAAADIRHESPVVYTSVARFLKQAGKKEYEIVIQLLEKNYGITRGATWVAEEVNTFLSEEF
jgi:3-methyladenine DNA glycosylase AlkD